MTALLITVAFLNIGLLAILITRHQPGIGLPQRPAQLPPMGFPTGFTAAPYSAHMQPQASPAGYSAAGLATVADAAQAHAAAARLEEVGPLVEEAARQLDQRMDRLEKLITDAEVACTALDGRLLQTEQSLVAKSAPAPAPIPATVVPSPARRGKVRFLSNNLVQNVITLSDAGYSPLEIARELGRGVDEVTLALNLRHMAG